MHRVSEMFYRLINGHATLDKTINHQESLTLIDHPDFIPDF